MFARGLTTTLVHFALKEGSKPRLHPNGFVQLDLVPSGDVRFHVWPAQPIAAQKTRHPIHDHGFDMESLVLTGHMVNVLYTFAPAGFGPSTHVLHTVHGVAGKGETVLECRVDGTCIVREIARVDVLAGQTYTMPAAVLHDSQASGLTATIMTKARPLRGYRPLVAVPIGVQPDNDFRRAATDETLLRGIINQALESITLIKGECNHEKDVRGNCCFQFDKPADVNSLFRVDQPRCC